MPRLSAGLLLYRRRDAALEVMLVHMGGPFWACKDSGAWSLPKGEHDSREDPLAAARREFAEELGLEAPAGDAFDLGTVKQSGGKLVHAWAIEADIEVDSIRSNTFPLEWPRGSGKLEQFPEVDRAGWFAIGAAREKLVAGQRPLLDRLAGRVAQG